MCCMGSLNGAWVEEWGPAKSPPSLPSLTTLPNPAHFYPTYTWQCFQHVYSKHIESIMKVSGINMKIMVC